MATLFISDLHLYAGRPAITELFLDFLRTRAAAAEALYILGDLFEFWVGDDATSEDQFRPIVDAIRRLTASGVPVRVMRGNRDFLMGPGFESDTGCRLLPDPSMVDLYGTRVLLMHGDTLCTADTEYMAFRTQIRNRAWQRDFLTKSLAERNTIFSSYREISKASTAKKSPEIMDVTQDAVESALRAHGAFNLIHGHTHRPGEHVFKLDGRKARRVVLGDWYQHGSVLRCDRDEWVLERLPLPARARLAGGRI